MSKIYIATDSSPVDMQSYELCCDMIDLVIDVSCIYGCVMRLFSVKYLILARYVCWYVNQKDGCIFLIHVLYMDCQ